MCRNIRTLFHFDPPTTEEEIQSASLQFVRKVTGMNKPSQANEAVFNQAVEEIGKVVERLFTDLHPSGIPKNRETEAAKAKERFARQANSRYS